MPRKPKSKAKPRSKKGKVTRRSREEVQSLLQEVDAKVAAGSTIKDALKKAGVSYSNYNYWKKREGTPPRRGRRGAAKGPRSVIAILSQMTENRRQADAVRKNLAGLDARFDRLKKQLERSSG